MENTINTKIAKDKLMILYIIKKSNYTITYNQLSNFILEYELINYFTFVEYYNELKDSNFFLDNKDSTIKLSEFSIQILELLEDNIDIDIKTIIDEAFSTGSLDDNEQMQIIPLNENKCIVILKVDEGLDSEFSLSFTLDNLDELKKIENNWLNKNKSYYREILKIIREVN